MKDPILDAINEIDSILNAVSKVTQKPGYAALKAGWPAFLRFLQPVANMRQTFSAESVEYFIPRFQKDTTSIEDEQATEKAVYLGVMLYLVLNSNPHRDRFTRINFDELSELWFSKAQQPLESLENFGFFNNGSRQKFDNIIEHFLRIRVDPYVKDLTKSADARSYFAGNFVSGVLLGQIVDYLTYRNYREEQDAMQNS